MAEITKEELEERVKELEEQNRRLRDGGSPNQITVTEQEYNGFPTLLFEGKFRSFTIGLAKLSRLKCVWPRVEKFLSKHSELAAKYAVEDDERI